MFFTVLGKDKWIQIIVVIQLGFNRKLVIILRAIKKRDNQPGRSGVVGRLFGR